MQDKAKIAFKSFKVKALFQQQRSHRFPALTLRFTEKSRGNDPFPRRHPFQHLRLHLRGVRLPSRLRRSCDLRLGFGSFGSRCSWHAGCNWRMQGVVVLQFSGCRKQEGVEGANSGSSAAGAQKGQRKSKLTSILKWAVQLFGKNPLSWVTPGPYKKVCLKAVKLQRVQTARTSGTPHMDYIKHTWLQHGAPQQSMIAPCLVNTCFSPLFTNLC